MTTHSVRRHLRLEIAAYDETIRRFIPGYEAMLAVAAREVAAGMARLGGETTVARDARHPGVVAEPREAAPPGSGAVVAAHAAERGPRAAPPGSGAVVADPVMARAGLVLDLGGGTGALAEAILVRPEVGTVALIDVDQEMLAQARTRLARFGGRVLFHARSFLDPLPACDGAAASLALHHVRSLDDKRALYRRIHEALCPGGCFVNADATMPVEPAARAATWRGWADHMVACGIGEEQAFAHFEEWAEEDTYFPLEEELGALRAAGFAADCVWREGGMTVLAGRKATAPSRRPAR